MTWLYVPGTSSACAPASADSNSASCSLSTAAPKLVEGSVTWRGKPQMLPAWSRRWRAGGFIRLLSGLTCSPSTLDHGVASFISSLRETPVRTTASPESAKGKAERGFSPPRSCASPKSAGLLPEGMVPWVGTDKAPDDWDGGPVHDKAYHDLTRRHIAKAAVDAVRHLLSEGK